MKLSRNFSLSELTKSQTAIRNGIDNTPDATQVINLQKLVTNVLQPIRDHFGKPVIVSSAFRSVSINSLIGGSPNSDHTRGMAADIEIPGIDNKNLAKWISGNLRFSQLILEFYVDGDPDSGWVHVAYNENKLIKEILTARSGPNGRTIYLPGIV